jgi:hypothetical protein
VKRALLVLLLLNVAFFGYARFASESGPAPGAAEPAQPVPRLALLSELKVPPGPSCLSVGPFGEHAAAAQAGAWLRNAHHLARERSAEVDGPATYWVAVTTKTLQQAARISMRLKAAGVNDIEVTPPGTNQTEATVSLGLYSDRERANRRVSDLRGFGVNPAIVEQRHKVTQWWLDVPMRAGDPPLDVTTLAKAVAGAAGTSAAACPTPGGPPVPPAAAPAAPAGPPAAPKGAPDPSSPGPAPAKLPGAPA